MQLIRDMTVTRIVVAHRQALIDAADVVYRVTNGQVVCCRSRRGICAA